jgi:hypothetical protein
MIPRPFTHPRFLKTALQATRSYPRIVGEPALSPHLATSLLNRSLSTQPQTDPNVPPPASSHSEWVQGQVEISNCRRRMIETGVEAVMGLAIVLPISSHLWCADLSQLSPELLQSFGELIKAIIKKGSLVIFLEFKQEPDDKTLSAILDLILELLAKHNPQQEEGQSQEELNVSNIFVADTAEGMEVHRILEFLLEFRDVYSSCWCETHPFDERLLTQIANWKTFMEESDVLETFMTLLFAVEDYLRQFSPNSTSEGQGEATQLLLELESLYANVIHNLSLDLVSLPVPSPPLSSLIFVSSCHQDRKRGATATGEPLEAHSRKSLKPNQDDDGRPEIGDKITMLSMKDGSEKESGDDFGRKEESVDSVSLPIVILCVTFLRQTELLFIELLSLAMLMLSLSYLPREPLSILKIR